MELGQFIAEHVRVDASRIIHTLAEGAAYVMDRRGEPFPELAFKAKALVTAIADYQGAAMAEGWVIVTGSALAKDYIGTIHPGAESKHIDRVRVLNTLRPHFYNGSSMPCFAESDPGPDGWEDLCKEFNIEPILHEEFDHFAVSDYLAAKLEERGERVVTDFAGWNVWVKARPSYRLDHDEQSSYDFSSDPVLASIAADHYEESEVSSGPGL